jgi:chromosome segregation ATPase
MEFPEIVKEEPNIEMEIEDFKEENVMPVVQEKVQVESNEVFTKPNEVAPVPVLKKTRKKRTMTPEMLEKLAEARKKANETRKKNKELRAKGEMKTPTQKKQEIQEIQEEKKRPIVNNITHEHKTINNNFTKEDIEKIALQTSSLATAKALQEYEELRKERKAIKKEKQEQEKKLQERQRVIHRSIMGGYSSSSKRNSIYG